MEVNVFYTPRVSRINAHSSVSPHHRPHRRIRLRLVPLLTKLRRLDFTNPALQPQHVLRRHSARSRLGSPLVPYLETGAKPLPGDDLCSPRPKPQSCGMNTRRPRHYAQAVIIRGSGDASLTALLKRAAASRDIPCVSCRFRRAHCFSVRHDVCALCCPSGHLLEGSQWKRFGGASTEKMFLFVRF